MNTLEKETIDFYGYQIPVEMNDKSKNVIKTLAECGCVEVFFSDETVEDSGELLRLARDYGITVYKSEYSFILCDNPVGKII
jgi:hypothetical protein